MLLRMLPSFKCSIQLPTAPHVSLAVPSAERWCLGYSIPWSAGCSSDLQKRQWDTTSTTGLENLASTLQPLSVSFAQLPCCEMLLHVGI